MPDEKQSEVMTKLTPRPIPPKLIPFVCPMCGDARGVPEGCIPNCVNHGAMGMPMMRAADWVRIYDKQPEPGSDDA